MVRVVWTQFTANGKLGPPVHMVHVQLGLSTGSQQSLLHSSPDEM